MSIKDITYDAELDALIFSPRRSDQKSTIVPLRSQTTFTKIVGSSSIGGSFPTLQKAFDAAVPGDSILVTRGYALTASGTEVCSVSNVVVQFNPGVVIDASLLNGVYALQLSGSYIYVERPLYLFSGAITALGGIKFTGSDNEVTKASLKVTSGTITNAYNIDATAARSFLTGSVNKTGGTVTNLLINLGTDSDASVRGG